MEPISPSSAGSPPVWSWQPTMSPRLRRNTLISAVALAVATVVSVAIAVATPSRFVVVLSLLLIGIGVLWLLEHRRFSATQVVVDDAGVLHVADGRQSATIDLATVDTVDVLLRTQPGVSVVASTPRWTINLAGPNEAVTHAIAHAGGLFNPDRDDVERLRAELTAQVERASGRRPVGNAAPTNMAGDAVPTDMAGEPGSVPPTASTSERFEWRPPVSSNAARNRRILRLGYGGVALAIAVYAVVSRWGDWGEMALSALTVPGLIVACFGGFDWALGRARRFRIVVEDGTLRVEPERPPGAVSLRGSTVTVDRFSSMTGTSNGMVRGTAWRLTVGAADGTKLIRLLPQWGTVTNEADYVALERELRQRT